MTTHAITLTYAAAPTASGLRVGLEQQRVAGNRLTTMDLIRMLSIIQGGGSARTYTAVTCPATVSGGVVTVPLTVWAWPVPLVMPYGLTANQGTFAPPVAVRQEREFDLIVNFATSLDLPFACRDLVCAWSGRVPCLDHASTVVDPPSITIEPGRLTFDRAVLGVVSIRCVAEGYRHTLTLSIPKGTDSIANVQANVVASWMDGVETRSTILSLELPGCVEQLLEACPDGSLVHDVGSIDSPDEKIPVVYYDECTGRVLELRYELP